MVIFLSSVSYDILYYVILLNYLFDNLLSGLTKSIMFSKIFATSTNNVLPILLKVLSVHPNISGSLEYR